MVRESRRWYWWVLVMFLLGVLIGWLLAPRCKLCTDGTSGKSATATAGGRDKLSGDADEPNRSSGPAKEVKGAKTDGLGSSPGHGNDAVGRKVDSPDRPSPPDAQQLGHADVTPSDGMPDSDTNRLVLKAADLRYDRTGLPRYAQSVSQTASTLSRTVGEGGYQSKDYRSAAQIVTSSRFEDVVDWYKAQLPAGWTAQVVGNVRALAQQASIDNILRTLTAATQDPSAAPSKALPTAQSNASSTDGQGVAMFSPPPNSPGNPKIMIQETQDQTIAISLSRDGTDP